MAVTQKLSSNKKRLILAALAGVAAALLMFLYAGNLEAQANAAQSAAIDEYGGTRTEVLVATRNILAGEELSADNTTMMPWLSGLLPQGALTDARDAYGKTTSVPIWTNEPLLEVKLGGSNEIVTVPEGLSAVCIPISDDMAVGGSLLPGSSVDVYAIGANQVSLVLADVLVLEASNGTGIQTQGSADDAGVVLGGASRAALKWITLAVRDETIPELLSAARDSKLSLVLPGDNAGGALQGQALLDEQDSEYASEAAVGSEEAIKE